MASCELSYALLDDERSEGSGAPSASSWIVFLHGILGSGANWRSFARQLLRAHPGWGAVTVDLRLHGESLACPPPHSLASAVDDVVDLALRLSSEGKIRGRVASVLGHSFGGKVALGVADAMRDDLSHVFVIDSTPSARPDRRGSKETQAIVDMLRELPSEFASREAFAQWVGTRGVSRPVAMWLAMNVKPVPNTTRYVFRLDMAGIRALLDDYFYQDAWSVLELSRRRFEAHLIVGGVSNLVDEPERSRARACPRTTVDVIENAGHWVHVDAPEALLACVSGYLNDRP